MGKKDDHMFVTVKHLFEDKMGEHQNINESKINEQDEEEIPQEEDSGVPSNQKGVEPDNSEPSEGEEEEADQSKVKPIPDSGEEKEYLGAKGQDQYYYIKTIYGEGSQVEDLLLLDASEKQLLSAKEAKLDPADITNFILTAIKEEELTLISVDIVEKYILKPAEEEEEEEEEGLTKEVEDQTPEIEPAVTTPEMPKEETPEFKG